MRRGYTLIEMVTAITVGAVLTGIAISVLLVMFRSERSGRSQRAAAQSLEWLADQFRQDVHAAVGEPVRDKKDTHPWQFDLGAKQVAQYTFADNVVSREQRDGGKLARTETYRIPKESTVSITIDRKATPPIVSLTIEPNESSSKPGRPFRVDAVLGRDLRFTERQKEGK